MGSENQMATDCLKAATHDLHAALDSHTDLRQLMQPTIHEAAYARVLSSFAIFFQAWDQLTRELRHLTLFDFPPAAASAHAALLADLREIGREPGDVTADLPQLDGITDQETCNALYQLRICSGWDGY